MPTFEVESRFWNGLDRLTTDQRRSFTDARHHFVAALRAWESNGCAGIPSFPKSLGVKPMTGHRNIMELAWSPDGRCTWNFGTPRLPGK